MVDIIFPSAEAFDLARRGKNAGFTDGKTICINLYTKSYTEQKVEERITVAILHEILHCCDMNISEREVLYMTKLIYDNLKIIGC